ncbi:hypothetical protein LCGC14_0165300 [marine sediment metagenome]|uniref:Methyltransferase type 11 domain-containing protein n=1 Tax=marine sediment metagenome TaxID=412755 RepID=A0A0F9XD19_9ZZZZ
MATLKPEDVPGHMAEPQMTQLEAWVRRLRVDGPVVEVGCYKGRSASQFGVVCQELGRHLICVDPWIDGSKPFGEQSGYEVFNDFLDNMDACGLERGKDFTVHRLPSVDAVAKVKSAALIFIDGNHERGNPLKDFQAWLPKVASGGMIAAHDCRSVFEDVWSAWHNFVIPHKRTVEAGIVQSMGFARIQDMSMDLMIDVGCGGRGSRYEGFTGLDIWPASGVTRNRSRYILRDVVKDGLPFGDNSVDFAVCQHMLEHIPRVDGLKVVKSICRVLKPGAKLVASIPDLRLAAEKYLAGDEEWWDQRYEPSENPIWKGPTLADKFMDNLVGMGEYGHQYGYDYESISHLCREAGFSETGQLPDNSRYHTRRNLSAVVEATK